ncbi:cytochrome p450 domain-containing protein [Hirsutella rhossiliensis]|uniref:Cytochrome p450 domain-containing protein n=1 Tax=Hirsutella rhossiliensis TaxID=111463 RepID=A0A9P8SML6_9HYPO|nr:cytochrome p450 domain-containing protein [Hirsutella rhossiliensis]KAH0966261.1 cytochrome p450 domain-containing protein [Hirsutella rhossiliensis]
MGLSDLVQSMVVYAACLFLSYLFLLLSYRATFHPLSKYPGPFFAKILDGYGGVFAASRRLHLVTYENHMKYGPVVRQGPNRLVFNTASSLHDVDVHRRKRKIVSQPLTEKAMRKFEPVMSEQIDVFVQQLHTSAARSEPINMTQRCMWLGGDIVGQLAFGYSLRQQTDDANRWLQPGLALASARINVYMQAPVVRKLEPLLKVLVKKARAKYVNITTDMIKNRLTMDKHAKHDLYSFAVDDMGGSVGLANSELWAEAFFFIVAGGNTTATTMSAMFFYLSRNLACYKKLAHEIRSAFKSADEIHPGDQLRSCVYLQVCISETLRCATPNTGTLWRQQLADDKEPLIIDGHVIPRGTDLGVNLYAIHHNEEYFPDPFVYRPERWLESETSKDQLQKMKNAFAPFILGARSCPGKSVAHMEINLTFARTLWNFDFEAAPGEEGKLGAGTAGRTDGRHREGEYQLYDTFSAMHDGPSLKFYARA